MSDAINNKMQPVEIIRSLEEAGHQALYVGGFVRDSLLGLRPEDADIATSASPEQVVALFQDRAKIKLQGRQFGVVTVDGVEVAMFRGEAYQIPGKPEVVSVADFAQDAARRDFTINAMGMAAAGEILDPIGGQTDLRAGVIRAVGDPDIRFREDPARLLRAVTFAARFGFVIEVGTADSIRRHADLAGGLPKERIAKETNKMLDRRVLHRGLELLRQMRLLPWVLPELMDLAHSDEGSWIRTLQTVRAAESMNAPQAVVWAAALAHCVQDAKRAGELAYGAILRLQGGKSLAGTVQKLVRWQRMRLPKTARHALRMLRPLARRFPTRPLLEGFIHDLLLVRRADACSPDTATSRQRLDEISASQAAINRVLAVAPLYPREAQIDGAALGLDGPKAGRQINRLLYRAQMQAIGWLPALTLAGAIEAASQGAIEDWVHAFLLTVGKNEPMVIGLKKRSRYWLGPIKLELSRLQRCCGPEKDMEYPVDPERFDRYVTEMVNSIKAGWQPPPLIAVYDHGSLSVRDGNHRHEALKRAGYDCYWTVVWFNDQQDYLRGCHELGGSS